MKNTGTTHPPPRTCYRYVLYCFFDSSTDVPNLQHQKLNMECSAVKSWSWKDGGSLGWSVMLQLSWRAEHAGWDEIGGNLTPDPHCRSETGLPHPRTLPHTSKVKEKSDARLLHRNWQAWRKFHPIYLIFTSVCRDLFGSNYTGGRVTWAASMTVAARPPVPTLGHRTRTKP